MPAAGCCGMILSTTVLPRRMTVKAAEARTRFLVDSSPMLRTGSGKSGELTTNRLGRFPDSALDYFKSEQRTASHRGIHGDTVRVLFPPSHTTDSCRYSVN